MPYTPPTLAALKTKVARDLRDPTQNTFNTDYLGDFIHAGLAELNLVRPVEFVNVCTVDADLDPIGLDYVFLVELVRKDDGAQVGIAPADNEVKWRNGWELFAGALKIDRTQKAMIDVGWSTAQHAATHELRVWGYRSRFPAVDGDTLELASLEEETAVRRFAVLSAYRHLMTDRSLFQQWLNQTNNTDMSPTQMENLVNYTESDWARLVRRLYRPRRPIVQG